MRGLLSMLLGFAENVILDSLGLGIVLFVLKLYDILNWTLVMMEGFV